jgi:para-aminobenzoate synthetase component 2
MLLLLDNYDSFTYNLAQYLIELGEDVKVIRNDKISVDEIKEMSPTRIVISPGPKTPAEAGVSIETIKAFNGIVPIFGVCLGHQAMAAAYGGKIIKAERLMHGKTSPIHHDGQGIFEGIKNPFEATRYHSLIVDEETLPDCFEITARTSEGEIMGIRHKAAPTEGAQFHPESIICESGKEILKNFLAG